MFVSFFPQPRLFFLSAAGWSILLVLVWFFGGAELGSVFGLPPAAADAPPIIGVSVFWSQPFLWFYIYFAFAVAALLPRSGASTPRIPGGSWSILGSALILFTTYFQVQVERRASTTGTARSTTSSRRRSPQPGPVDIWRVLQRPAEFRRHRLRRRHRSASLTRFFVSHYIFRWRTAMNDYYMANWPQAAPHRRRVAARPGRHDALLHDHGGPGRQPRSTR